MITFLRYLPVLAILAALSVLVSIDPARFTSLRVHWGWMIVSAIVLYAVFWFRALTWWYFLRRLGVPISVARAVRSRFITIPTKYLPGKIWPLLSTAAHVESPEHAYRDSLASVGWYQVAIVVSGIGVGAIGVLAVAGVATPWYPLPLLLMFVAGALFDRPWFAGNVLRPLARRLRLSARPAGVRSGAVLGLCAAQWALMAVAYWLMFRAVAAELPLSVVLAQPLANVTGMLVPFTPAGLGVREAAGAGYIATQVGDAATALLYAALARAWSFGVEAAVFCTGAVMRAGI